MNILLWVLQIGLGLQFLATGLGHFIVPPGLPGPMAWMYDMSTGLHYFAGTAEILIALGLILPGLTGIQPRLTTFAALGLVVVMLGAAGWHITRGEFVNVGMNLVLAALAAFVAYGRSRLIPLKARGSS